MLCKVKKSPFPQTFCGNNACADAIRFAEHDEWKFGIDFTNFLIKQDLSAACFFVLTKRRLNGIETLKLIECIVKRKQIETTI